MDCFGVLNQSLYIWGGKPVNIPSVFLWPSLLFMWSIQLDPLNELHLFALQYTLIPRINKCLQEFKSQWENHTLSSEGNLSPIQLYTAGMLENERSGYAAVESVFDACSRHDYGFDPSAPVPLEEEDYQVVVPDTSVPLSDQQIAFAENHCNPLQENDRSGEYTHLSRLRIFCSLISQDIYIN